jgi:hypothetical protein
MTADEHIPPRPPHEIASGIAAIVGILGATGMMAKWHITADELAVMCGFFFFVVALGYAWLTPEKDVR